MKNSRLSDGLMEKMRSRHYSGFFSPGLDYKKCQG